jgi:hypothetical protein
MLKYKEWTDFMWVPYYPNNMPENGQDGWVCTIEPRQDTYRTYRIEFQLPIDEEGFTLSDEEPELYILFERSHDKNYSGPDSFIRAFKTLEEAKKRAYLLYSHIYGYVMSFLPESQQNEDEF